MKKDITVIIPAKLRNNQEAEWLIIALASIPKGYPIVLVNDHSEVEFPQVKPALLIDNKYGTNGLAATRNHAMKFVETEYFFPLDADDYLMPNALEIALSNYQGKGYLYGSTLLFNDKQRTVYKVRPFDICKLLEAVYWPNGCLQKTENYHKVGGWDESLILYEDWDYWLRSAKAGITGHYIDDVLYCYRQNPNGIISTLKRNPDMVSRAKQMIVTRHEDLFSGVHPMSSCCGGRNMAKAKAISKANIVPASVPVIPPILAVGMLLLTYQGGGLARTFYGVSGTTYRFSSTSRKLGYVAEEDVAGLLAMKENGKFLFSK